MNFVFYTRGVIFEMYFKPQLNENLYIVEAFFKRFFVVGSSSSVPKGCKLACVPQVKNAIYSQNGVLVSKFK